jgi:hypothetical protein
MVSAGILSNCAKKSSDPTPATNVPTGLLELHLHNYIDTSEVEEYQTVYTATNGRKISLTKGQVYLSNIQLVRLDGSFYPIPGRIVLKVQEQEVYLVGNVPAGNYQSVLFTVGLDSATNAKVPAPSDTALYQASMWFGTTAQPEGYIFINAQGSIDTTANADGKTADMQSFKYLIGTESNSRQITMPDNNYTITPNQTQFVHIVIDYSKLFTGIALDDKNNLTVASSADNASALARKIAGNIPSMFSYEYGDD